MSSNALSEHLAPLAFLVGKTWRGEFTTSTPEKPMVDIMRWEAALKGTAIRVLHSVNNGDYGGETMMVWDTNEHAVVYYYFTTSGFYTRGTLELGEGHYTAHESVTGNANGITAMKAHTHLTPDGKVNVSSQYFRDGSWVEGHEITYHEEPNARLVLE